MLMAGRLRRQVTLSAPSRSRSATGADVETFADYATVAAEIRPMGGSKTIVGGQIADISTHQVTIRYRSDIAASHRVTYSGRVFDIVKINDLMEGHEALMLECRERVNG